MIHLKSLDTAGKAWAQATVAQHHYLHAPVDSRCSVEGYAVHLPALPAPVGCLLFGRPQATRCYPWYGSVEDVTTGRAECTRWQILNLARVWLSPDVQAGGRYYGPEHLPGYVDRRGVFRSTLASDAIKAALARVGVDYLLRRPPVFPDEPYQVDWVLSYQGIRLHRGVIYRASGFEQYDTGNPHIQTWRARLPALTAAQHRAILARSESDARAIRYRAARAQMVLPLGGVA